MEQIELAAVYPLQVKMERHLEIPAASGSFPDACDMQAGAVWRSVAALRPRTDGVVSFSLDVAEETPLAIRYNGFPQAVMMGTPFDLDDFAVGFSVAEGIAHGIDHLKAIVTTTNDDGIVIAVSLSHLVYGSSDNEPPGDGRRREPEGACL